MLPRRRTAVVTGASSGIGYATALELAKKGYLVIAGARRVELMEPLRQLGIETVELDVTSSDSVDAAVRTIVDRTGGRLDVLFNNAGAQCKGPAAELAAEKILGCFQVNVFGTMRLVAALLPLVVETQGLIAFTGSTAGLNPFPFASVYSATKGAIHAYASTLALEVRPLGVKVLNVVTGGVATSIGDTYDLSPDSLYRIDGVNVLVPASPKKNNGFWLKRPWHSGPRMDPRTYAERVVRDFDRVLGRPSFGSNFFITYRGTDSSRHRWLSLLAPRWLIERKVLRDMGLEESFALLSHKR